MAPLPLPELGGAFERAMRSKSKTLLVVYAVSRRKGCGLDTEGTEGGTVPAAGVHVGVEGI